jgi:predicted DsbA family dithiol-disulfide isomerase
MTFMITITKTANADGLKFAYLEIRNGSTTLEAHYMLRAADSSNRWQDKHRWS